MVERIPFQLKLTGDTADFHQFQGYDGYMALAGFAWTLSLVTNYIDTGEIRHKGDFAGRNAVRAATPREGSVIADFYVLLQSNPAHVFGSAISGAGGYLLYSIVHRVIARNLGQKISGQSPELADFVKQNRGDLEALVAATEAPIRQAHDVIGNGATQMEISGGVNILNTFNSKTKEYVRSSARDDEVQEKYVTVSGFYGNSGHGSVFDPDIGRNVPIIMTREKLRIYGPIFSWALDQYINKTGNGINIRYTRILAMDGRPKKYVIDSARKST